MDATTLFKALSDPIRLRAVVLLERKGPLCVCEISGVLGEVQPKVSRHLAELRKAGLVEASQQGLWVFYRVAAGLPDWVRAVLNDTAAGTEGREPFASDAANLRLVAGSAERCRVRTA